MKFNLCQKKKKEIENRKWITNPYGESTLLRCKHTCQGLEKLLPSRDT